MFRITLIPLALALLASPAYAGFDWAAVTAKGSQTGDVSIFCLSLASKRECRTERFDQRHSFLLLTLSAPMTYSAPMTASAIPTRHQRHCFDAFFSL